LEAVLTAQAVRERPIRLMFQDEARFGRMARIRRCWAPAPLRPVVCNGYEREFTYVYGSVSPMHGELDWSLSDKMNTAQMAAFLSQVSQAHPQEFLVMVVDGASSHRAKELIVPENVRLISLPGYSPELNPQEIHNMGPLSSKPQFEKVLRLISQGIEEGAKLITGGLGRPHGISKGYFVKPTVFADVQNSSKRLV